MYQTIIKPILYISFWVVTWGTIGSLIDYPLLQSNIYEQGTFWQALTFIITSIICIILGKIFYKKFI